MAALRRLENIAEMAAHHGRGRRIHIEIDAAPLHDDERPDFIDAMRMIGMGMGQQDRVEPIDAKIEQLGAQIRPHIDQNLRLGAFGVGAFDEKSRSADGDFSDLRDRTRPSLDRRAARQRTIRSREW